MGDPILHTELRRWADIVLIAPCSANTLSKIAHGICDNLAVSIDFGQGSCRFTEHLIDVSTSCTSPDNTYLRLSGHEHAHVRTSADSGAHQSDTRGGGIPSGRTHWQEAGVRRYWCVCSMYILFCPDQYACHRNGRYDGVERYYPNRSGQVPAQ